MKELLFGRESFWTPKHPMEHLRWQIARLGVWICDHSSPRPCTETERASTNQYCRLMVDTLLGRVPWYGRDKKKEPVQ